MKVLKGEWAFISTQKCATNTMYKVLPGVRQGQMHHMPNTRVAPIHWTIVRNPYDRAVSLYGSTALRSNGDRYNVRQECGGGVPEFETFIERCLLVNKNKWKHPRGSTHAYLFRNQHDWIKSGIIDNVVHLENLYVEIEELIGLKISQKVKDNASPRKEWMSYMTPKAIKLLNKWAEPDFEHYGYQML